MIYSNTLINSETKPLLCVDLSAAVVLMLHLEVTWWREKTDKVRAGSHRMCFYIQKHEKRKKRMQDYCNRNATLDMASFPCYRGI